MIKAFEGATNSMDILQPLALLGGLSAQRFMQRHWQKKPLLIRQAVPSFRAPIPRAQLLALAGLDGVESRLVQQINGQWRLRHGPFARRALPPLHQPGWTLLVQGVDLYDDGVRALMDRFRFVPQARLDDLMISYASPGGGVGPHFDSYDVFLLQAHGHRRWRIGRQKNLALRDDVPLKVLAQFEPEQEFVLEPGDMLYLPPRYAHDGIAEDECMTYSVGFRAPAHAELAHELLMRIAENAADDTRSLLYHDANQEAVEHSAAIPTALHAFARSALERALAKPLVLERSLGEYLSEPKPNVWFDSNKLHSHCLQSVVLDRRTRMMYDSHHIFINGESHRTSGRDGVLLRRLADQRTLNSRELARASDNALRLLSSWCEAGWLHGRTDTPHPRQYHDE